MFTTRSKRRIKVAKELWPEILRRINEGEDFQKIADAYDCTVESLSYITKMVRTRGLPSEPSHMPMTTKGTLHLSNPPALSETSMPIAPSAPSHNLTERLAELSKLLTDALIAWQINPSHDTKATATETLHELRKILVRVEITLNSKPQS